MRRHKGRRRDGRIIARVRHQIVAPRNVRAFKEGRPIKIIPFPIEHSPVRVYAYWHPSREIDADLDAFVEIVRGVLGKETAG